MRTIRVELGADTHQVCVGEGLLARLGMLAREAGVQGTRAALITDTNVAALYGEGAIQSLSQAQFAPVTITVPPGEASKSLAQLEVVYDRLVEGGIQRADPIFALGGGVVGDLAGFAAATYLRGVPLVQVPTTVVAQVDSALGGKTGINHRYAKNLLGAFHHPRLVVADVSLLASLPEREFREGLAEVIKYGAIMDEELFSYLELHLAEILGRVPSRLVEVVDRSLRNKTAVVERDPVEAGERRLLNFGHTVGHALEAASGYDRYLHGEAVAIGMAVAAKLSSRLVGFDSGEALRLQSLIEKAGLPTAPAEEFHDDRFSRALRLDKKGVGEGVQFVLLRKIGQAVIYPVPFSALLDLLS